MSLDYFSISPQDYEKARQQGLLAEDGVRGFGDRDGKDTAEMTITLSPETEKVLREAAARQGTTPDELAEQAVKEKYSLFSASTDERRKRVYALMGSSRHLGPSQLIQDKAEEIAREERRWQP